MLLEALHVCKHYRTGTGAVLRALDDVSLAVAESSFVLLTGPSGSGKTTLLSLLGGLDRATGGQVLFAGRDLTVCSDMELARLRRRVGFIFQDFALIPHLRVWENVTYPLIPRGMSRAERRQLAHALLTRAGLAERMTASARELSGGEQQRVALARALAGKPELLVADEPTSNLDEVAGAALIAWLKEIHAAGTTIVVSSHDARFAPLATMRCELQAGKMQTIENRTSG